MHAGAAQVGALRSFFGDVRMAWIWSRSYDLTRYYNEVLKLDPGVSGLAVFTTDGRRLGRIFLSPEVRDESHVRSIRYDGVNQLVQPVPAELFAPVAYSIELGHPPRAWLGVEVVSRVSQSVAVTASFTEIVHRSLWQRVVYMLKYTWKRITQGPDEDEDED